MTESEAAVQDFHDKYYRDAHDEYIRWLRHNPHGYVLNLKTTTYAVLHERLHMHISALEWFARPLIG